MKMVRIGIIDGEPRLEWRDGWDGNQDRWQEGVEDIEADWTETPAGEGIEEHIRLLLTAFFSSPTATRISGDPPSLSLHLCQREVPYTIVQDLLPSHFLNQMIII